MEKRSGEKKVGMGKKAVSNPSGESPSKRKKDLEEKERGIERERENEREKEREREREREERERLRERGEREREREREGEREEERREAVLRTRRIKFERPSFLGVCLYFPPFSLISSFLSKSLHFPQSEQCISLPAPSQHL